MVASGTVTDANMTITLTAGSADIDFSSATVPRNYQGYELHIQDSAGREVIGFVYTNGAGTIQNIVSAKGGSTRNWTYQHASFDTTDDYKYQLFKIWNAPIVASGPVTAANSHLDTTAANAFAWLNGVDLSAFQDGRHMLWVYDSSGRGRGGFISSSAPAGETLGTEEVPNNNAVSDSQTETNATTGFLNYGTPNTFESTNAGTPNVGSYHFHVISLGFGLAKGFYKNIAGTVGALYKWSFDGKMVVGGSGIFVQPLNGDDAANLNRVYTETVYTSHIQYGTAKTAYSSIYISSNLNPCEYYIDNYKQSRVTDPPSTAVKILSAKAGARGWLYSDASYDPNTAATYAVLFVGD